eukprot:GDKI01015219.1.p2 GENE.GDKI01015219.1~~GDKI01015219.1.p2  ORF type:complete len:109 (+),score=16.50 GDKI01015219.1:165-491(+)
MATIKGSAFDQHMRALRDTVSLLESEMQQERALLDKQKEDFEQHMVTEKAELQREREMFEKEKENMGGVKSKQSDIIELNVGGKTCTTTRATLCAMPDTLLAAMFSGR